MKITKLNKGSHKGTQNSSELREGTQVIFLLTGHLKKQKSLRIRLRVCVCVCPLHISRTAALDDFKLNECIVCCQGQIYEEFRISDHDQQGKPDPQPGKQAWSINASTFYLHVKQRDAH